MNILSREVLKLNTGFIPIEVISVQDALCLIVVDKAYSVIEDDSTFVRSPSIEIKTPLVIAMRDYNDFPKKNVAFSKLNVIYRDDMTCQYCGKKKEITELTVDHIIPKARWNKEKRTWKKDFTNWNNLVCCCKTCNYSKGSKLLSELKWKLLRKPFEPTYLPRLIIKKEKAEKNKWVQFCKFNVRLI